MTGSYRRAGAVLWRRCGDAVVVLPRHSTEAFTIQGAGSTLWDLLGDSQTFPELVAAMSAHFDEPPPDVAESLRPALDELVTRGAVEALDPSRGVRR